MQRQVLMSERLRGCENTFACDCVGAECLCLSLPLDVLLCLLLALRVCVFVLMSSTPSIRHVVKCMSHNLLKKTPRNILRVSKMCPSTLAFIMSIVW